MTVYHYCSFETFLLIIQNKTLRLSDITKSNDSKEISWITDFISETFIKEYEKAANVKYFEALCSREQFMKLLHNNLLLFLSSNQYFFSYYVLCFSSKRDLLSQWRGYANDGRGVSIGFDDSILDNVSKSDSQQQPIHLYNLLYRKIEYTKQSQQNKIRKVAKGLIYNIKKNKKKSIGMDSLNELFVSAVESLAEQAVFMKNPFFKEESEYRLCIIDDGSAEEVDKDKQISISCGEGFRLLTKSYNYGNGKVTSYFDLSYEMVDSPLIKEIVLGPKNFVSADEVRALLKAYNVRDYDKVEVSQSEGTYR